LNCVVASSCTVGSLERMTYTIAGKPSSCTKRQGENQIRIHQIEYHSITQTLTKKADQIGARKSEQGVSRLLLVWPPTPPSRRSPARCTHAARSRGCCPDPWRPALGRPVAPRAPTSPACHRRPTPSPRWHSVVGRQWEDLGGTKPRRRRGTARRVSRAGRGATKADYNKGIYYIPKKSLIFCIKCIFQKNKNTNDEKIRSIVTNFSIYSCKTT
jgi:hypothetical protein